MTGPREHSHGPGSGDDRLDELTLRYREASAQDPRRPATRVRDAARAHAQAVLDARETGMPHAAGWSGPTPRPAANQSRWKVSLLASIALAGLTSLIVLQVDRGSADEQAVALGDPPMREALPSAPSPSPQAEPSAAPPVTRAPSPAPSPAPTPTQSGETTARASSATPATPSAQSAKRNADIARPAPATARAQPDAREKTQDPERATAATQMARTAPLLRAPALPAPDNSITPAPAPPAAPAPVPMARMAPSPADAQALARAAPPAYPQPSEAQAQQDSTGQPASPPPSAEAAPAAALPAPRAAPGASRERSRAAAASEIPQPSARRSVTSTLPLASALQEAARKGHASQLNRLLVRGAPLNAADTAGRTPLMLAVIHNHPAMVQGLLAAGANVALVDHDGLTALQHARRLARQRIVRMIEESS